MIFFQNLSTGAIHTPMFARRDILLSFHARVRASIVLALLLVCTAGAAQEEAPEEAPEDGLAQSAPPNAPAQASKPTIMGLCVVDSTVDQRLGAQVCGHIEQELEGLTAQEKILTDGVLARSEEFDPEIALRGMDGLLEDAQQSYKSKDYANATRQSERILESLLALEPWMKDRQRLETVLLLQAKIFLSQPDQRDNARAAAARILRLVPFFPWRNVVQDQELLSLLQEAEQDLKTAKPGLVVVQSNIAFSEVYLDGFYVGVTPLQLQVPQGEHLIRVRKPGYIPSTRLIAVQPGTENDAVDLSLDTAHNKLPYDNVLAKVGDELGKPQAGPALRELRSLLYADQVMAGRFFEENGKARLKIWLYDLRSEQLLGEVVDTISIAPGNNSYQDVHQLIAGVLQVSGIENIRAQEREEESPLWSRWWFWTGIGAATLTAVTVGIALSSQEEPLPPKPTRLGLDF